MADKWSSRIMFIALVFILVVMLIPGNGSSEGYADGVRSPKGEEKMDDIKEEFVWLPVKFGVVTTVDLKELDALRNIATAVQLVLEEDGSMAELSDAHEKLRDLGR